MEKKENYLDILKALSKKENKLLLGGSLRSKLFRKKLILQEFFDGRANLSKTFWSILPEALRPKKVLMNKWENDLDIEIMFHYLVDDYPYEPVNLLCYQTYYLPQRKVTKREKYSFFFVLVYLIKEIIIADQYCAQEFIKNDSVVIDAGANVGIFSLYASYLAPKGKVYCFEPTKSTFEILEKNIKKNKLDKNIYSSNSALGEKIQETEIQINTENLGGGNSIIDSKMKNYIPVDYNDKQKVGMTTIDDFIKENHIQKVDFIKIDTEGYEKQILKGARETIKKFHPVISCSAYHLKDDKIKIPELVKSINPNYKFKLVDRFEEDLVFWV